MAKKATAQTSKGKNLKAVKESKLDPSKSKSKPVQPVTAPKKIEGAKSRVLVTSAPHFKFETEGETLTCKVLSKVIPDGGKYEGKLIGWNVLNVDTGEKVMIGNTNAIERALTMKESEESELQLWQLPNVLFQITWLGLSELGEGRTFNNYDIQLIEQ